MVEIKDEFNLARTKVIQKLPQEMKDRLFLGSLKEQDNDNYKKWGHKNYKEYVLTQEQMMEFVEVAKRYESDFYN